MYKLIVQGGMVAFFAITLLLPGTMLILQSVGLDHPAEVVRHAGAGTFALMIVCALSLYIWPPRVGNNAQEDPLDPTRYKSGVP